MVFLGSKTEFYQRLKVGDNTICLGYDFWAVSFDLNLIWAKLDWAWLGSKTEFYQRLKVEDNTICLSFGLNLIWAKLDWAWLCGLGWALALLILSPKNSYKKNKGRQNASHGFLNP